MVTTSPAASTTRLCACVARARNRRGEKRGIDRRLTGVATVASGSSGRRQGGHTVAGDLGGRSLKKRSGKPLQGASARVAWRGRCRGQRRCFWNWRRGEGGLLAAAMANGGDGCARGSQGREGKREPEEGERSRGRGEVRGGSGRRVASPGVEEGGNQAGGGQARWRCSPPSCFVRWHGKKTGMPPGGWAAQCWAVQVGFGERQVSPSLSLSFISI